MHADVLIEKVRMGLAIPVLRAPTAVAAAGEVVFPRKKFLITTRASHYRFIFVATANLNKFVWGFEIRGD